ncbi:hypothetical protein MNB_SM-6-1166 [hydrothermal vent metagenome]|uniref:Prepilin-type N-terminal cleavage/methylation domain-containing protein n=1 Tax=hydrothermal vent metagenome TaxID=652676 RepID=A0A1W1BWV0_9ZZZZ
MRKAFTLIELMISITILSIMMLFLYKSYADMNVSNRVYVKEAKKLAKLETIKKITYLDLSLAFPKSIKIIKENSNRDILFMQTKHSLHRRILPFVAYIMKDKKLYRLESRQAFTKYPLNTDISFDIDYIGKVKKFRIYAPKDPKKAIYLFNIVFKNKTEILQRVKVLTDVSQ